MFFISEFKSLINREKVCVSMKISIEMTKSPKVKPHSDQLAEEHFQTICLFAIIHQKRMA